MAPPSEEAILTNYLLRPSPLPTVISLEKFTELFPKKFRSHPQVRTLYRELQQLRAQDVAFVRERIDKEVRRGVRQKRDIKQAGSSSGISDMKRDDQVESAMDIHLFGQPNESSPEVMRRLGTLLPDMERCCASMEGEIARMEAETSEILSHLSDVVGGLSDLRYGKLNKPAGSARDFADETVKGLKKLEDACNGLETGG